MHTSDLSHGSSRLPTLRTGAYLRQAWPRTRDSGQCNEHH